LKFLLTYHRDAFVHHIGDIYIIVRVYELDGENLDKRLDGSLGKISEVASIIELADQTWEIVVLDHYLPCFLKTVSKEFPESWVDVDYDPFQPDPDDISYHGYHTAQVLCMSRLGKRADRMIADSWEEGAAFYTHLKEYGLPARRARCFRL
jgi:hypothetical protein